MRVTEESAVYWRLFGLAHSAIPAGSRMTYLRQVSFSEMMDLPNVVTEAFGVIEAELYAIQAEGK